MADFIIGLVGIGFVLAIAALASGLMKIAIPILTAIGGVIIGFAVLRWFLNFLFSDKREKEKTIAICKEILSDITEDMVGDNKNCDLGKLLEENNKRNEEDLQTNTMDNHYEILGIDYNANLDEIVNAYENKKALLIEDYGTATNKKGKRLFKAYATLSDETSRAKYDEEYKQFLHRHSKVYSKLVPMFKKNEDLYKTTNDYEYEKLNKPKYLGRPKRISEITKKVDYR
ncbi:MULTISPECIES: DnaJ domain-containing protein [unclassified Campylobacter]|uniref:J domain-containing protein n=1 Tax=unclassified Campylobacter TaxID=2593542 RepID=UPI001EFB9029|nr:DnaJ domain-containing protein [Campylobacter sp. RM12651]MBZ7976698.1 DnaJ domain-containing protein [Campylobacter sp. RM12637]ULO02932.1 DnaJ domain-containing protein [Campylobacter sp. RM12651]